MNKTWKNIKKSLSSKNTQRNLLILLFLLICIALFIYMEKQQTELNTIYDIINVRNNKNNNTIETFATGISIVIDGEGINKYDENNKLKLLNGNDEFNFEIKNLENKTISSIKFINTTGIYQDVELNTDDWVVIQNDNDDKIMFSQFLNLDTSYRMIVNYLEGSNNNKSNKTINYVLHTNIELNYKKPEGGIIQDDLDLKLKTDGIQTDITTDTKSLITSNMKQFNYVVFKINKPDLSKLRIKLLETEFENDTSRDIYIKKLEKFDKLVPLKFNINLQLIKKIGENRYIPFSEIDLHKHRKEYPIPERIILPNPNCNECDLQIRNVIANQFYNMKIRLEYYYLDNIKNVRATPYLNFNFKVIDEGDKNSFSISKLDIVGKLEENANIQTEFEESQKKQDTDLDNIENKFNNLIK